MLKNKKKYFYDDFDDVTISKKVTKSHYTKNSVTIDIANEDITESSNNLIKIPCDYKSIFGYMAKDKKTGNTNYIKYDKNKELMVIYDKNDNIIMSFHRSYRDFVSKMYDPDQRNEYIDEIPKGK